nr:hypothetical protein [Megasphaera cerevisiae]
MGLLLHSGRQTNVTGLESRIAATSTDVHLETREEAQNPDTQCNEIGYTCGQGV